MSTGKKLERSNNRLLGGVCAGIAETFDWDVVAVRIAYVLLTLFTAFSGTLVYILLWIIMPPKQ